MPTDTPSALLVWRETRGGDDYLARTPFGNEYEVTWNEEEEGWYAELDCFAGSEIGDLFSVATYSSPDAALEAARAACEADCRERMRAAGWVPAGEVERLRTALRRLMQEAVLDGMESRAGWDCWIAYARAVLTATPLTPTPAAQAVPADAIRAEIAWLKAEESRRRREQRGLCHGLLADAHAEAAARLSALLPRPAQEDAAE